MLKSCVTEGPASSGGVSGKTAATTTFALIPFTAFEV
jgi:hypothetical protein